MSETRPFFPVTDAAGNVQDWAFWCAGCERHHSLPVNHSNPAHNWTMSGPPEAPTFRPSLLCRWTEGEEQKPKVCHSFVTDGQIQYLSDCTHALAGQTLKVEPEPEDWATRP